MTRVYRPGEDVVQYPGVGVEAGPRVATGTRGGPTDSSDLIFSISVVVDKPCQRCLERERKRERDVVSVERREEKEDLLTSQCLAALGTWTQPEPPSLIQQPELFLSLFRSCSTASKSCLSLLIHGPTTHREHLFLLHAKYIEGST